MLELLDINVMLELLDSNGDNYLIRADQVLYIETDKQSDLKFSGLLIHLMNGKTLRVSNSFEDIKGQMKKALLFLD